MNRQLFQLLSATPEKSAIPHFAPNPLDSTKYVKNLTTKICYSNIPTFFYLFIFRKLFFISDPSHLIKTTRNNLWSSYPGGSKYLWNGEDMTWSMIANIFHESRCDTPQCLVKLPKLSVRHIYPNSYDKMKVNFAAQVLSNSVANEVKQSGNKVLGEFLAMMNTFFDICNSSIGQSNPTKAPFHTTDDPRLSWLKEDFVGHLNSWSATVNCRLKKNGEMFTPIEKEKMKLSHATHNGLIFTALSLVSVTKIMLNSGAEYVILKRLSQDVLEAFFGHIREQGGCSRNPNMPEFSQRMHTVNVMRSLKRKATPTGNISHLTE